ncbi:phosphoribosylanthranilate isomerase [Microbacterium capsulatum]|uniref:N-(5'-phosphoribosyl)anthranilate isomerase n=1 Tax=Microbacterium capsulatum TaxID=3041921 RepID=A0ABU0XIF8_9MICO|nr:phosphoribosylanthranilate isomerase [Microbacterium sp. ASV81]MDQ4214353.1 phosphoribosylanthranilate isomerase [Microbacterium sp. ASV81]
MIVQIYTAQSAAEAVALAERGVNHVGLTPTTVGLPGQIGEDVAAEAVTALRGRARSVALSVESDLDEIARMAHAVGPDILHLCGEVGAVDPKAVRRLRGMLPEGMEIMQAIAVGADDDLAMAIAYAEVADFLILDSYTPDVQGVGAAGVTHDWSRSAGIVEAVDVPVVLAGGLSAANVAEAIRAVRPWGVDSLTHTNRALPGGGFEKDLDAVAAFVAASR